MKLKLKIIHYTFFHNEILGRNQQEKIDKNIIKILDVITVMSVMAKTMIKEKWQHIYYRRKC